MDLRIAYGQGSKWKKEVPVWDLPPCTFPVPLLPLLPMKTKMTSIKVTKTEKKCEIKTKN